MLFLFTASLQHSFYPIVLPPEIWYIDNIVIQISLFRFGEGAARVTGEAMYDLFELDNAVAEDGLQLLYVTSFRYEKRWIGTRHAHSFLEIFFCVSGDCEFFVRDSNFTLHPYEFVLINPDTEHVERAIPESPVEWVVLGIKGGHSNLPTDSNGYYHGSFASDSKNMVQLLTLLISELQNKNEQYSGAALRIAQLIMIHLSRITGRAIEPEISSDNRMQSSIAWVKQYIDDNYTSPLSLEMLSDKVGLNRYGLIREFKKRYAVSPIEYMLSCRFRDAKFLLETTDRSIVSISGNLGFNSGNYFSQSFQKRFGMSPSAYRAKHSTT